MFSSVKLATSGSKLLTGRSKLLFKVLNQIVVDPLKVIPVYCTATVSVSLSNCLPLLQHILSKGSSPGQDQALRYRCEIHLRKCDACLKLQHCAL